MSNPLLPARPAIWWYIIESRESSDGAVDGEFTLEINKNAEGEFTPKTDEDLKTAVKMYLEDPTKGEETYGHITTWDLSQIDDIKFVILVKLLSQHFLM